MGRVVTTTGSKKLKTLKEQFNEHFPYLSIHISSLGSDGKTLTGLNRNKESEGYLEVKIRCKTIIN